MPTEERTNLREGRSQHLEEQEGRGNEQQTGKSAHDLRVSSHLLRLDEVDLPPDTTQVRQALEMLGLRWAPTP